MKFRENFSAEDDARLTPCEDDKPKVSEISPFQAGSDYLLSVRVTGLELTLVSYDNFTCNCSKFLENTSVLSA